jgi:hypothetical protein
VHLIERHVIADAGDTLTYEEHQVVLRKAVSFIAAAVTWLGTRYTESMMTAPVRQARRSFERSYGRRIDTVRIICLRRAEHKPTAGDSGQTVEWSHRWMVDGHWRNQPHGPNHSLRKLTWIAGHIKGPDDKPLVVKSTTFVANR